jgi:hypothetical protein
VRRVKGWLHLRVLRHKVSHFVTLGNPGAEVYGFMVTCTCGDWWTETVWKRRK